MILDSVFDDLKSIIDFSEITIYKYIDAQMRLVTYRGPTPPVGALSISLDPSEIILSANQEEQDFQPIIWYDLDQNEKEKSYRFLREKVLGKNCLNSRSRLLVPLRGNDDEIYFFQIGHKDPGAFTEEQIESVITFGEKRIKIIKSAEQFATFQQRAYEAEILLSIQLAITSHLDSAKLLQLITNNALQLTFVHTSLIVLIENNDPVLVALSGKELVGLSISNHSEKNNFMVSNYVKTKGVTSISRIELGLIASRLFSNLPFLFAPIEIQSQIIGIIIVADKRLGIFDDDDQRRLQMLASAASVGLENAWAYQQARHFAVLEERARLAGEMHDELAQSLSYLKLQVSIVEQHISAGDQSQTSAILNEMRTILNDTYTLVREDVFNLQQSKGSTKGFLDSLEEYLDEYRIFYGVNADLIIEMDKIPTFSSDTEVQIIRSIQESLSNIRRHAQANQVWVRFSQEFDQLVVSIQDDGRGFDVNETLQTIKQHYGLKIMRERVGSFGGHLEITSEPGIGTKVCIHIPRNKWVN